jgi:hypothetical protein
VCLTGKYLRSFALGRQEASLNCGQKTLGREYSAFWLLLATMWLQIRLEGEDFRAVIVREEMWRNRVP